MRQMYTAVAFALMVAGCVGGTGGERFEFEAFAVGSPSAASFTNERSWQLSLSVAELTIGPIYLNAAPSLRANEVSWWSRLVPTAYAAGDDHMQSGRVLGEVLAQVRFDALSATPVAFPQLGSATRERVRTSDIWFYPPSGLASEATKNVPATLRVVGVAQRAGQRVAFRGDLVLDDSWLPEVLPGSRASQTVQSLRQVRGVPSEFLPVAGGHLEVRVDVRELFRGADFSSLSANAQDPDGTRVLSQKRGTTDQVMTNLNQGLHSTTGPYRVQWVVTN